jgi:hypothetical protein
MCQDGILDGVEEQKKALLALGHKMDGQLRSQQEGAEKQLNRLRTDMARVLAPAHPPSRPHSAAALPEPSQAASSAVPDMRDGIGGFTADQDQPLAAPYLQGHVEQGSSAAEAAAAERKGGVLPDADASASESEAGEQASVYKPSQRLSPSSSGSGSQLPRAMRGNDESMPVDLGCKRMPASPLVPRLALKRCVSDDAVPASLRCAAIVVCKRLFLFPKGRDGMCDLQFAMVRSFLARLAPTSHLSSPPSALMAAASSLPATRNASRPTRVRPPCLERACTHAGFFIYSGVVGACRDASHAGCHASMAA